MLWILDSTYRIPDPLSVELGLRIPIAAGLRIPGAEFRNPRVKFQNPKPKIPDSMSERLPGLHWWGDSLISYLFSNSLVILFNYLDTTPQAKRRFKSQCL